MNKKNLLWSMICVAMTVMLSVSLTACGPEDEPDIIVVPDPPTPDPTPDPNPDPDPDPNRDPEGTVVLGMVLGTSYDIGLNAKIYIDGNTLKSETTKMNDLTQYSMGGATTWGMSEYDFYVEFASVGKVNGLGQITTVPTTGWSKSIVVTPGTGYVARMMRSNSYGSSYSGKFTRLFVAEQSVALITTVKYQTPFEVPFTLEKSSITLSHRTVYGQLTGTIETIKITNGTRDINVTEKPDWCYVTITPEGNAQITANKNPNSQPRTGKVVLKNSVYSASINVTQSIAPAE